jgi:excisionase family DNA binding protein
VSGESNRRLLSLRQLAKQLGCRFETARDLVDRGRIASVVVGNKRRVPARAVDAWLERIERGAA